MNTACLGCRSSNPNLLDKPTGRLFCIKCGAEIIISDAVRNSLAKKNMFAAPGPVSARAPAKPAVPDRLPPPPQWTQPPQVQQPPAWQQWNPNAVPAAARPAARPQYERPVARPAESNQQAAVLAARARLNKMHRAAGISETGAASEEIREGVVQFSERTPAEAAEYRQYVKESLQSFDGGINRTTKMPKTDFVREEFGKLGISVDALDSVLKGADD